MLPPTCTAGSRATASSQSPLLVQRPFMPASWSGSEGSGLSSPALHAVSVQAAMIASAAAKRRRGTTRSLLIEPTPYLSAHVLATARLADFGLNARAACATQARRHRASTPPRAPCPHPRATAAARQAEA